MEWIKATGNRNVGNPPFKASWENKTYQHRTLYAAALKGGSPTLWFRVAFVFRFGKRINNVMIPSGFSFLLFVSVLEFVSVRGPVRLLARLLAWFVCFWSERRRKREREETRKIYPTRPVFIPSGFYSFHPGPLRKKRASTKWYKN
jgi:hypothetical protein